MGQTHTAQLQPATGATVGTPSGYPGNYTQQQPGTYQPAGPPPAYSTVNYPPQQPAYQSPPVGYAQPTGISPTTPDQVQGYSQLPNKQTAQASPVGYAPPPAPPVGYAPPPGTGQTVHGQVQGYTLPNQQTAQAVVMGTTNDVYVLALISIFFNPCLGVPAFFFAHTSKKRGLELSEVRRYRRLSVMVSALAIASFMFIVFFLFTNMW